MIVILKQQRSQLDLSLNFSGKFSWHPGSGTQSLPPFFTAHIKSLRVSPPITLVTALEVSWSKVRRHSPSSSISVFFGSVAAGVKSLAWWGSTIRHSRASVSVPAHSRFSCCSSAAAHSPLYQPSWLVAPPLWRLQVSFSSRRAPPGNVH